MQNSRARTGIAGFVFAALLVVFNWPVMSIPAAGGLLSWLFAAWGAGIALLALTALLAARLERRQAAQRCGAAPGLLGPDDIGGPGQPDALRPQDDLMDDLTDERPGCGDV